MASITINRFQYISLLLKQMFRELADTKASGKGQQPEGQEVLLEEAAFWAGGTIAMRAAPARARLAVREHPVGQGRVGLPAWRCWKIGA
ncbi:MAG: hypothetical protein NTU95_10425 [Methanothrix sp.]|nr:hypothetical protein [Methanothrix sp.]